MGLWDAVRRLLGRTPRPDPDEEPIRLLWHFMCQLGDEFYYAQFPTNEQPVANAQIIARIRELFATPDPPTWRHLYQIERLLVYVRPRSRLENETDRRV